VQECEQVVQAGKDLLLFSVRALQRRSPPYDQSSSTNRAVSTKDVLGIAAHFEKMLYDTALLSRVYLHAYQASGDPFFRRIVEETLDYVLREMTCVDACIDT